MLIWSQPLWSLPWELEEPQPKTDANNFLLSLRQEVMSRLKVPGETLTGERFLLAEVGDVDKIIHCLCIRQDPSTGCWSWWHLDNVKKFIRKCIALVFVPIRIAWQGLKAGHQAIPHMDELISYMEDTWIAGMFPINMWNVYQATGPHTNNHLEGWHKITLDRPSIWTQLPCICICNW